MFAVSRYLLVAALAVGFVSGGARAEDKKPEKPGEKPAAKPQQGEPVKPIVIQIDASKLPPDVLKQLIQLSEKTGDKPKPGSEPVKPGTKPGTEPVKPAAKAISLSEAVAIVEKTTKATVLKAEREEEDGKVEFEVTVLGPKGEKVELTLDAKGTVIKKDLKGENKKGEKEKK